jgi:hypothetical protein
LAQEAEGVQTIRFALDMLKQLWGNIFIDQLVLVRAKSQSSNSDRAKSS